MKLIPLTQGKFAMVDDDIFDFLNQWKWYANKTNKTYYAGRIICKPQRTCIKMHRLIMGSPIGMEVDHIDHNGLNNQRHNLRNCTRGENQKNKNKRTNSEYIGLSHFSCNYKGRKYNYIKASIMSNRKKIHIGCFKTEEEAARAYDKKAKELHGEFANLNFK